MKFIDWFAGIGGFRKGMEQAGHECVGFCEFDRFAVASYTSMHLLTDEQREHLMSMPLNQRQKEILKDEYRNGEWYAADVRRVCADDIPSADCWCFGFPCQDISISGKQVGFQGNRSSLFFRVMYLLGQCPEEKKPHTLFIENVKNLLSVNGGWDFARLLIEMDRGGYDAEWQVLNSKDFGVPQNRERCFVVGHSRRQRGSKVFPVKGTDAENSLEQVGQLYGTDVEPNPMAGRIYNPKNLSPSLDTCQGGNRMPKITTHFVEKVAPEVIGGIGEKDFGTQWRQQNRIYNSQKVGTAVCVGITNLYDSNETQETNAIWYPREQRYVSVRKLTPKECFRLQGWDDEDFEKAQQFNSDSQLYKQAGNGVTVNVIKAIAEKL